MILDDVVIIYLFKFACVLPLPSQGLYSVEGMERNHNQLLAYAVTTDTCRNLSRTERGPARTCHHHAAAAAADQVMAWSNRFKTNESTNRPRNSGGGVMWAAALRVWRRGGAERFQFEGEW
jgi:hypothetical protein